MIFISTTWINAWSGGTRLPQEMFFPAARNDQKHGHKRWPRKTCTTPTYVNKRYPPSPTKNKQQKQTKAQKQSNNKKSKQIIANEKHCISVYVWRARAQNYCFRCAGVTFETAPGAARYWARRDVGGVGWAAWLSIDFCVGASGGQRQGIMRAWQCRLISFCQASAPRAPVERTAWIAITARPSLRKAGGGGGGGEGGRFVRRRRWTLCAWWSY